MNSLLRTFTVEGSLTKGRQIVIWWEKRRLKFNSYNLAALIIGLFCIYVVNFNLLNFFLIPFIFALGIILNVVYTLGWIIIAIALKADPIMNVRPVISLFSACFFVFSVFFTLCTCLLFIIFNLP